MIVKEIMMNSQNNTSSGQGSPRRRAKYSIADIIRSGLIQGKAPEAILQQVKRAFPDAKTSVSTINNYRSQMRKQGHDVPTVRLASKRRKSAETQKKPTIT